MREYMCILLVIPSANTFVTSTSVSESFNLIVQPYPDMENALATFRGSVDLLNNTATTHTLTYTWRDLMATQSPFLKKGHLKLVTRSGSIQKS